jgi:hypothetical protein
LSWSINVVLLILEILNPVCGPAGNSGNCKKYGEHIGGETHGLIDQSRIEVYVGIELPCDAKY